MLKYAYKLEFSDTPDYNKLIFMLKKLLLERDYLPDNKFDWSLGPEDIFKRVDHDNIHSSISSCDIKSNEAIDNDDSINDDMKYNLKMF